VICEVTERRHARWHSATTTCRARMPKTRQEFSNAGHFIFVRDFGVFRALRGLHPRIRESLIMENILVGIVAVGLMIYLFAAMLRPEKF
jgi:K+-transporting ATPase KdpF subunit